MYTELKELKVLLVEDEEKVAHLLKKAIGDNFASFYVENNGRSGLERFIQISPDLVITDIMMPDMTGLEMAKELKKINANVNIIILSAYSETEKFLSAIDVGIVKYFIKPFDPDELLDYIVSISKKLQNDIVMLNDELKFNKQTNSLYKCDKYISLTKREMTFLQLLINKNAIISNDSMSQILWNEQVPNEEKIRTFIRRFRAKTSKDLLTNIKGQGYQLN
jgi:DNA-binding response OmpR family regulator